MGFFRQFFGAKKPVNTQSSEKDQRKRWSFTGSSRSGATKKREPSTPPNDYNTDANKRAIAVAAATAAVAEAALVAAHAAAEVVRLTSNGGRSGGSPAHVSNISINQWARVYSAAVKIQAAFRGYLARRALRALKALVKLQALVRGNIIRKQTADMLRRMQTLAKVQARARATRKHMSESFHFVGKSYRSTYNVDVGSDKNKYHLRAYSTKFDGPSFLTFKRCGSNSNLREMMDLDKAQVSSNWLDQWMEEDLQNNNNRENRHIEDDKNAKILEVDTWKPHFNPQQSSRTFRTSHLGLASDDSSQSYKTIDSPRKSSYKAQNTTASVSSGEFSSITSPNLKNKAMLITNDNTSRPGSSGQKGVFRGETLWGYFNDYSGHPNYMSNTESSRAKARSQSVPKQRTKFEKYGSPNRLSVQGYQCCAGTESSERSYGRHF